MNGFNVAQQPVNFLDMYQDLVVKMQKLNTEIEELKNSSLKKGKVKSNGKKKEKDKNAPPQPLNNYIRWKRDYSKAFKQQHEGKDAVEINRLMSIEWHEKHCGSTWIANQGTDPIKDKGKKNCGKWSQPGRRSEVWLKYNEQYEEEKKAYKLKLEAYTNQKKTEEIKKASENQAPAQNQALPLPQPQQIPPQPQQITQPSSAILAWTLPGKR